MFVVEINWDAVAAISQVIATFVTAIAILVSLRIANLSITSKAKIIIGRAGRFSDKNHFVFLNVGHNKIILKAHGLFLSKSIWPKDKNALLVISKTDRVVIESALDYTFEISDEEISSRLKNLCGCKSGEEVKLILFFLDTKNKRFEKKFRFKVL
ncbi:hypothetical protein [Paenibacillus glucanolyticus]|uniref:hypothetical protein n=1 Tax=Paenibacillus glucanolyticus TaxID=59843 RepID=UPI00128C8560|nr:hypothetical protein [Paenibacillus glucanolyticus]MPY20023.1 hypothetical protein [Paenibacillus glucanolyticus]